MAKSKTMYLVYIESVCDCGTDRHFNLFDNKKDAEKALSEARKNDKNEIENANTYFQSNVEYQYWEDGNWLRNHCVGKIIPIMTNTFESAVYAELF